MSTKAKHPVAPAESSGLRVFVRTAYPARYNFAVENYNAVSVHHKTTMRGGRLLLFRSVVAVAWIIAIVFAFLALIMASMVVPTVIISVLYIALSVYNAYVFFHNRTLLNASRLLKAKVAGPNGLDYEWVSLPLDSRSANERLAAVEQSALDNVRREFVGSNQSDILCLVYTKRYAETYPTFPKELFVHLAAFVLAIVLGVILAAV